MLHRSINRWKERCSGHPLKKLWSNFIRTTANLDTKGPWFGNLWSFCVVEFLNVCVRKPTMLCVHTYVLRAVNMCVYTLFTLCLHEGPLCLVHLQGNVSRRLLWMDSHYHLRRRKASSNRVLSSPSCPLASAGTMALSEEQSRHLDTYTHMHHILHVASGPAIPGLSKMVSSFVLPLFHQHCAMAACVVWDCHGPETHSEWMKCNKAVHPLTGQCDVQHQIIAKAYVDWCRYQSVNFKLVATGRA